MNKFINQSVLFLTELAEKGATVEEMTDAIQFSSKLLDILKEHNVDELMKKYNIGYFDGDNVPWFKPKVAYEKLKVTPLSPPDYCNMINTLTNDCFKEKIENDFKEIIEKEKNWVDGNKT